MCQGVVVTAAGRILVEGSIIGELSIRSSDFRSALQASNTPIEVSLENNSVFGLQTRRFMESM
jgi:hypothetical protein